MLICGDFNLPKILWESPEETTGVDEVIFQEQLNDYFLSQLNNIPSRENNVLDLVISSVPNQVENISTLLPSQSGLITDHSAIIFDFKTSKQSAGKIHRTVFDYRRGDFDGLRRALLAIDLSSVINPNTDINSN